MIAENDAPDLRFDNSTATRTLGYRFATFRIELRNGVDPYLIVEYSPSSQPNGDPFPYEPSGSPTVPYEPSSLDGSEFACEPSGVDGTDRSGGLPPVFGPA